MERLVDLILGLDVSPIVILDIGLTALLIYGLFSLIRGTRAVRLVIGVTILYAVYVAAQVFGLQLLSQILQTGAVVGLLAIVVVFQPELRRALERIGRVGSLGWLMGAGATGAIERVASEVARAAAVLSAKRQGALIVLERETGLEDTAETGVMLHADLSAELLTTIFTPRAPLHDGAVVVRGERALAAGVVLPLSETSLPSERFGTRHRAALGITEQTDAVAVVVSEETGAVSLVERAQVIRHLDEERLRTALVALLRPGPPRAPVVFAPAHRARRRARLLRLPTRPQAAPADAKATDGHRDATRAAAVPAPAGSPAGTPRAPSSEPR